MPRMYGPRIDKRVILNRQALDKLHLAVAEGLEQIGIATLEMAAPHVPDDPSTARRIVDTGGWAVFMGSKKVGGTATKPRTLRTGRAGVMTVIAGYGSPLAHLHERGTSLRVTDAGRETGYLPAQPFLLPAFMAAVRALAPTVREHIKQKGF